MNLVDIVGWSLVHSLWEGAVIAVLLLVLLRVIDVRRAVVRYSAAVVALLLVVALPPITAVRTIRDPASVRNTSPSLDLQARASAEVSPGDEGLLKDPDPNPSPGRHEQLKSSKAGGAVSENAFVTTIQPRLRSAFPWLVAFWIAGVVLLSIRLFSAWLGAQRLKIQGISPAEPSHQDALDRLQAKLGVIRPIRLLQSAIVQVPAVIGWMRPVILLPASLATGLTIAQLEAILAHELAHVRRHDYLVNLLQAVIETLLFYHPAVWWISRQVRKERENCCDDLAVHACGDVRQYAGALLTLEEHRAMRLVPAATGGDLLARIRRLAAPRLSHAETSSRWLAGLIAIAAVLLLAGSAAFFDPYRNALVAQDRAPQFAPQDAAVGPDTVIRHPNPSAPLPERWGWARQLAATQRFPAFWIGYTIDPMPGIDGMIYVGRLERKGITGSGGLNLRGRITSFGNNFGNFEGFRVPGVMLPPLVGGGMPDDVAMLFAFVLDDRGRPGLARVHISSLALPVDLQDRPLLWLGDAVDEESIALVQTLYQPATTDLKPDVVAAMGVHGSKAAVPHLSRWLESGDATAVREEAAEWLGRHPDPAALSLLARTARADQVSDVRREAAEAVAEMKLPAATDTLIGLARGLNDNDARREAVEGLAEKSDPRAMAAALEIARNDRDIDLRREAVETLGEFKNGAGVPHLIELARTDRAPDVRSEAVETLGEAASPDVAISNLSRIIQEEQNEDVAREAVETLGEIEDSRIPGILRELAKSHPRAAVRSEAIETLAELDPGKETISLLSQIARTDQDEEVQSEAIESLGELDNPEATRLLSDVAKNHANVDVRSRAVEMLGQNLEPQAALEQLKEIARTDPNPDVQREAVETLGELPADLAVPALSDLARNHPNEEVRVEAVETLGEQGPDRRVIEGLTEIARSNAPEPVIVEAIETLGELENSAAMEVVVRVAESRAPSEVRREAVETIGEHASHEVALKTLTRIARANDDVEVQREAVETIGESQQGEGIAELTSIARTHPNAEVRAEAMETLGELGAPVVVDILNQAATSDASYDVQEEAVESLAELPDGAGVPSLIRIARDHPNRDIRAKALSALGESDDPRAKDAIAKILQ